MFQIRDIYAGFLVCLQAKKDSELTLCNGYDPGECRICGLLWEIKICAVAVMMVICNSRCVRVGMLQYQLECCCTALRRPSAGGRWMGRGWLEKSRERGPFGPGSFSSRREESGSFYSSA